MTHFLRNGSSDMAKVIVACAMLSLGMNSSYLGCVVSSTIDYSDLTYALRACHK